MAPQIDLYSLATVPIEQLFNDTSLGNATGFIWESTGRQHLVTNRHVMTCRNFETGQNLHSNGGRPNKLRLLFNVGANKFGKRDEFVAIRDADNRPTWLIHPAKNTDLAVLPLAINHSAAAAELYPINTLSSVKLRTEIGMDVFVLGYPFGAPRPGFPVWKRGSIASEPQLAPLTKNYFLVDTSSRPGMSGAPVIRRSWGQHLLDGGSFFTDGYSQTRFLGVYSGRLYTKDQSDAQLGMVWPAHLIDEIIAGAKLDTD
jgi:hypothetical protein